MVLGAPRTPSFLPPAFAGGLLPSPRSVSGAHSPFHSSPSLNVAPLPPWRLELRRVSDTIAGFPLRQLLVPNQRADLMVACKNQEKMESMTVLLCETSGCGKSTLSALLGSRLDLTTVISTDSIRHMMRSFVDEKQNPLLWASTYHAGECLDLIAVVESKAIRKAKKLAIISHPIVKDEFSDGTSNGKSDGQFVIRLASVDTISKRQMAVQGFKAQSEMVIDSLDRFVALTFLSLPLQSFKMIKIIFC